MRARSHDWQQKAKLVGTTAGDKMLEPFLSLKLVDLAC
jgi:hypothetical protein